MSLKHGTCAPPTPFFFVCKCRNSRGAAATQKSPHGAVPPNQPVTSSLRDADMGPLSEPGVKQIWGRGTEKHKVSQEKGATKEPETVRLLWGGGGSGQRTSKKDVRCAVPGRGLGPRLAVRGVTLTAETERSLI